VNEKTIKEILDSYGFEPAQVHEFEKGYRNRIVPITLTDGRRICLIVYKNEPGIVDRIKRIHGVSRYLAAAGFPVRLPIDSRIIRLSNGFNTRHGALYDYLPGQTIPWESYTKHHTKLLGALLSDLHSSLKTYEYGHFTPPIDVTTEYSELNERMYLYFNQREVHRALKSKLGVEVDVSALAGFRRILRGCGTLPDKQALHMDFVRSNILFANKVNADDKSGISGILDFEKTAYGSPLFDIARTLAFLLVDCKYKSEPQIRKYFLHSGYNKRGASKLNDRTIVVGDQERSLVEVLVDLFLMHDFYKFLKHSPYEFLTMNEHFIRTKDILVNRRLIRFVPSVPYPYPKVAVDMVELNQAER